MSVPIQPEKNIEGEEWYQALIEELKAIITETTFNNRWMTIEQKWNIGDYLLKASEQEGVTHLLTLVSVNLNISDRELWRCLQFRKQYPDLNKLPEGKNITWHKIVHNLLPQALENKIEIPRGTFSVIYADPPWPYPEHKDPKNLYGSANYHYSRMSIKEICDLGIKRKITTIKAPNSVLFLWVATNFLPQSFDVLKAWGFNYKSQMVWVKDGGQGGIGYYCWGDHEILLIATSGSFLPKKLFSSVYRSPREKHSKKPDYYYNMIEKMYPDQKYLELFARNKRGGWTSWGDDANL